MRSESSEGKEVCEEKGCEKRRFGAFESTRWCCFWFWFVGEQRRRTRRGAASEPDEA
ncbi:hypothetical protein CBOM_02973 [Ceraceosorus bombacis]|uniref:Uncharacterized protein n=1 Tax=Ceraceosorus bombacis TaxID=401625 RepID=A0A0N7LAL0_9BASI|nr:hypothetical protein CBOM_02973 [Ceraceosorus bombacis]